MSGGVRVEISNGVGDDFARGLWTIKASLGEHRVSWKLPDRLMSRPEVVQAASEEIVTELKFYIERIVPIQKRFGASP